MLTDFLAGIRLKVLFLLVLITWCSFPNACEASVANYFPMFPDGYKKKETTYQTFVNNDPDKTLGTPGFSIEVYRYSWIDGSRIISDISWQKHYDFILDAEFPPSIDLSDYCELIYKTKKDNLIILKGKDPGPNIEDYFVRYDPYMVEMKTDLGIGGSYSYSFTAIESKTENGPATSITKVDETIKIIGIEDITTHYGFFPSTLKYEVTTTSHTTDPTDNSLIVHKETIWTLPGMVVRQIVEPDSSLEIKFVIDHVSEDIPQSENKDKSFLISIFQMLLTNH